MPNSCNSITKNLCIALLVSSCASTQNFQAGISLNGKFLASNGSNTFPFNVSLQSNSDVDIIQIKKPFYGNVFRAEIDEKNNQITHFRSHSSFNGLSKFASDMEAEEIIKVFYRCFKILDQEQSWGNEILKVSCLGSQEKISLKLTSSAWTVYGFLNR